MGQGRFSHSDLRRMLNHCVGDWDFNVTTHSVVIWIGKRTFAVPKGKGVGLPNPRRAMIEDGHLVQLVEYFDIDRKCVQKYLAGLRVG